ncbi:MAG TPA: AAA family ATPase [Candidatus Merdicola faecigallinarum]|uniref:endopeptidase La n=1 Tax=Candidatus Merdicola faecigallinarum TaxID=2840862 RepID=A0A9D1M0Y6_9FIRM|nr:AAA family ATPase [Candidatus Merdicola faecigallinarum]
MKKNELSYKDLRVVCNPNIFHFETTESLEPITTGIGQDRGIKALEFGIHVTVKGYNLYLEGPSGVGKTMYTKNYLDTISKKKKVPNDWCYIYNFERPNEPIAVALPAGQGKEFKEAMDSFIKDIKNDIKNTFNNEDFEKEKSLIKQEFEDKRTSLMEKLNKDAMKQGFYVKSAQNGIYMMPVINGKTIEEEEFEKLDESIKKEFEDKSTIVQQQIIEVISEIKAIEKQADKKIEEWQSNIALLTINVHINNIKSRFKRNKKITTFLNNVKQDILKNISMFITEEPNDASKQNNGPRPESHAPWLNYRVNLFVDNSNLEGAPVIMDSNYSYHNIFGKLEYENYYGSLKTDHTMLKPGLLQMANGGYIIFQADDLISNSLCYEALKKALKIKEISIENAADQRSSMVMVSLKPEPIPLDIKVILIGNSNIYNTLLSLDNDFRKLFKIKVEFEDDAPRNLENMQKLARFAHGFCSKEELPPLDRSGVAKLIDYATALADDKEKLSTRFNDLSQILGEAATWAKIAKSKIITGELIEKALAERIERVKKYDSKYLEMIKDNTLLITTSGFEIGQINGLTVLTIGDYSFGKPAKITANTYIGKSGVINVEREVELSGSTHSKGVFILTGYLGEQFAQEVPLCLTASICFEQLYNGVDGDSASSTELYAILSSLSEVPINQAIAVTGSVNQKGEIQPIGGVNEKIEGFYQICKERGLDGSHGVMIPVQNVKNLHLPEEIVNAVKKGLFHVYAVSTIDEGIEVLTGVPAGKKDKNGNFPAGTINYLAYEKLKKYAKNAEKI